MICESPDDIDAELMIDTMDALPAFAHDVQVFPGIVVYHLGIG